MSSGAKQATGPARGADLDEPVVVGERAPAVGAAGADASLAQQCAERAGEARAMLGKKGAPSLFKFEIKVVPREGRASGRALRGVVGCLSSGWRRCYANQCWRGRASGRALRGFVGCLSWN